MADSTNDLKVLHEAVVGREIPMEMEIDAELSFQYAHNPYVDQKVPLYGMPEEEEEEQQEEQLGQ